MKTMLLAIILTLILCFPGNSQYAIKNVSVIPMTRDIVLAEQTVIVENGKITTIGPTKNVAIDGGLHVVDGTGKYLIPGLIDMHTHFFSDVGDERHTWEQELKLMLAHGLTTVRLTTGHPAYLELKRKIAAIASIFLGSTWLDRKAIDLLLEEARLLGQE